MHNQENTISDASKDSIHTIASFPARYENKVLIGQGGMGMVFHAHDSLVKRDVAIKVLLFDGSKLPELKERFLLEAKSLAALNHPNIVKVLSSGLTENGDPYHVLEYIDGKPLSTVLKENLGPINPKEFHELVSQIIDGLAHIHEQKIVHRDLKPSNILLCKNDEGSSIAKIIDFGIVRLDVGAVQGSAPLTKTNVTLGSPAYMSPEQCRTGRVNSLSDIYSLGCIMHELLSGSAPLVGQTEVETMYKQMNEPAPRLQFANNNKKSRDLASIVESCLKKDPAERPQSAIELGKQLEALFEGDCSQLDFSKHAPAAKRSLIKIILPLLLAIMAGVPVFFYFRPSNKKAENRVDKPHQSTLGTLMRFKSRIEIERNKYKQSTDRKLLQQLYKELEAFLPDIEDNAYLFAAHQMNYHLLGMLKYPRDEQIANQQNALKLCGYGNRAEAKECYLRMAYLYLSTHMYPKSDVQSPESKKDFANTLKYVGLALESELPRKNEGVAKKDFARIDKDLWSPEGSQIGRANQYLAIATCLDGDYKKAETYFAEVFRSLSISGDIGVATGVAIYRTNALISIHREKDALESLERFEKDTLCPVDDLDLFNKQNLPEQFFSLADWARLNGYAELARKFSTDAISMYKKFGINETNYPDYPDYHKHQKEFQKILSKQAKWN